MAQRRLPRHHQNSNNRSVASSELLRAICTVVLACALFAGVTAIALASAHASTGTSPAAAATATLSKTGTDERTGTTATGGGPAVGARPGDVVDWTLSYANASGRDATATITDPVTAGQQYLPGTLRTPPTLTGSFDTASSTLTVTGSVPANTTSASSGPFSTVATATLATTGGDGFSIEGFGANLYTVFHHTDDLRGSVYCATLASGAACPGWPGNTAVASVVAGTRLQPADGTAVVPRWTSSAQNGSFISGHKLYWPVGAISPDTATGQYPVGIQCVDLVTIASCGVTQLAEVPSPPPTVRTPPGKVEIPYITGTGIPASDGHYYYFDGNGDVVCFDPAGAALCGTHNITGGHATNNATQTGTFGDDLYATYLDATDGNEYLSCYDTATSSLCAATLPVQTGAAVAGSNTVSQVLPVLSATGQLLGGCSVVHSICIGTDGTQIADPWATSFTGNGTGVVVGTRYYTIYNQSTVGCYDFALPLVNDTVAPCNGFDPPGDERGYTVRALVNLPGCMAADGDAGEIVVFAAASGGPCEVAVQQSVPVTPTSAYCDGRSGHVAGWGSVTLAGLAGSEYASATVTVADAAGDPVLTRTVPGGAPLDVSLSALSATQYPSLTARVALSGITDTSAVQHAAVVLSWTGDPIQVCFKTVLSAPSCSAGPATVDNLAAALTTVNGITEDVSSGRVRFVVSPDPAACPTTSSPTFGASATMTSNPPPHPVAPAAGSGSRQGQLALTGFGTRLALLVAGVLVVAGVLLLGAARRRIRRS
jgi:hypothetical protein